MAAIERGKVAAAIHKDMVDDNDNGYSWNPRWGEDGKGVKTLTIGGNKYSYDRGSYDCSSSVITAWKAALAGTKWAKSLDAATYTGNMRSVFVGSGLFEWKPLSFIASPGDLYLDEANHVAMCQSQEPDLMSEFSINENGGVYGGKVGDQTGREAAVNPYRDFADGILHYNGKADEGTTTTTTAAKSTTTTTKATTAKTAKKRLNGIDISSWQSDLDPAKVDGDFVIVKVSGGTSYVNPYWKKHADAALKAGKLLGLYHYACEYGRFPGGKAEAEYFLKQIKGYEGKFVPCLDWEADATSQPVSYAKAWLDAVAKGTGATPMFYGYASNLNAKDYSAIKSYPLWMASYLDRYDGGSGYVDDPANTWATGVWAKMTCYQYSSTRTIKGYGSRLDVNVFYGTADDWAKLCGSKAAATTATTAKASTTTAKTATTAKAATTTKANAAKSTAPLFRVSTDEAGRSWLAAGERGERGKPIRWIAAKGLGKYRVFTRANGWLPYVSAYDTSDLEDGCAGDGSEIQGVEFKSSKARYAVRVCGGEWYKDMLGRKDTGGSSDHFAGDLVNAIDGFYAAEA